MRSEEVRDAIAQLTRAVTDQERAERDAGYLGCSIEGEGLHLYSHAQRWELVRDALTVLRRIPA